MIWPVRSRPEGSFRALADPVRLFLVAEFTLISGFYLLVALFVDRGADARLYRLAALAWLDGGDPWAANDAGVYFAAPPPTLVPVALFARLPEPAFVGLVMVVSLCAAVFALRRLGLPPWWLLFPPLVEAITVGNPNVAVVALLIAGRPVGDALATFLKVYAVIPLLLLGRFRALALLAVLLLVTAPLLPWALYLQESQRVLGTLGVQSSGGKSAWVFPILVPFVLLALIRLGRQKAAWLAVPALWPATQVHYSVLALPAATRLIGAILALPIPGAPAIAVIAAGVWSWRPGRSEGPRVSHDAHADVKQGGDRG
jgi:hypothetical protein